VRATRALGCAVVALSVVSLAAAPAQALTDTLAWKNSTGLGTSGSPIVDVTSGKVVGVNNTSNRAGGACTENNPCAMDRHADVLDHHVPRKGTKLDLTKSGCLLRSPSAPDRPAAPGSPRPRPG
jgi:hypothetical protein